MGYPRHQEFSTEEKELQVAVCWLEEQKIRLYPSGGKEREEMRNFGDKWLSLFKKYLDDLHSPEFFGEGEGEGEISEAFEWLSSYALQLDYSDAKERFNGKTAKVTDLNWKNKEEEMEVDQEEQDSDYHSPLYAEELRSLCKNIGLQVEHSNDVEEMMKALSFDITTRFTDSAIYLAKQRAEIKDEELLLGPFSSPLEFTTGQDKVDRAACVLRFLHIVTLRQLQALINELIGIAQVHTADPKTNLKLGKVGV
eukprot:CAMPEP_0201516078 /NCGR_PEP_ID=MMETSP0161_2-20130828/7489_1 /ASSEMBLY_ACC=CAM_ASM_000251 /TAXON_ID=180227 /ORGANISM="Neoparamoeba aestuarina, Strain SoJaBio B1-5/56/2" /LENGTH=252 /DNA_ID=CAMNT_0047913083 /DNA_START=143 /DNA_END=901 /DNA_ORIENTATION=+